MFGNNVVLALDDSRPVELDLAGHVDAVLFGVFEVVVNLGVEEQRLGRNAAPVQAGAAKLVVLLDESRLEAVLTGADGGGISGGASADDGYVVDCVCQVKLRSGMLSIR